MNSLQTAAPVRTTTLQMPASALPQAPRIPADDFSWLDTIAFNKETGIVTCPKCKQQFELYDKAHPVSHQCTPINRIRANFRTVARDTADDRTFHFIVGIE